MTRSLIPAAHTSSGQLTNIELFFLNHYKASVWPSMSFRQDESVHFLNRDWAPQVSLSKEYLLYSILSISANHSHVVGRDPRAKNLSLLYRQRALTSYNKALANITTDNYETLLITATYMMVMVPPPDLPCDDTTCLIWISAVFSMMQGLRLLVGLKWAAGIEKLTVFPIFKRELRDLPPPPKLSFPQDPRFFPAARSMGDDPTRPNPPSMYTTPPPTPPSHPESSGYEIPNLAFRPQELMNAGRISPYVPKEWKKPIPWEIPSPAFLPPPLMALLKSLINEPGPGPLDLHRPTLLPAIHAFTPIFLSLYYHHLNPDFYVRVFVLPTFLTPEFFALVSRREPRALIIVGWWFAFVRLIPEVWTYSGIIPRVLQFISNEIMRSNDKMLMDAMEGAYRVVRLAERKGREEAARGCFEGWEGVNWEEGPMREEEWRFEELINLSET